MQSVSPSHAVLVAAARHGLSVELAAPLPVAALTDADVEIVRLFCRTDRIAGLLAEAVRVGEVAVAPDHVEAIIDDWHQGLRACVLIEALLVRLARRLDEIDVRWAMTKGSAVAHLDFPDPALRLFADVDLMVHPDDWSRTLAELEAEPLAGRSTRSFTRRFGKGETLLIDGTEADLHLRFAVGRFGVLSLPADCFRQLATFELAGHSIPALAAEYRLLHACFHAVLGGNRGLRASRDVVQLVAARPQCVLPMWAAAERWNATAVVATALKSAWEELQLRNDHPVALRAREVTIGRADRSALETFANDARFRAQAATALSALPLRQRPGFLLLAWQMAREARR